MTPDESPTATDHEDVDEGELIRRMAEAIVTCSDDLDAFTVYVEENESPDNWVAEVDATMTYFPRCVDALEAVPETGDSQADQLLDEAAAAMQNAVDVATRIDPYDFSAGLDLVEAMLDVSRAFEALAVYEPAS